ncbi:MAG: ketoacyl-ACP synthase III [Candidatus Sericytochromatia bacterium]
MLKGNISGGRAFKSLKGVKISGSATAFPEPLKTPMGLLEEISNEDIFKMLLGENYHEKLKHMGMEADYPEKVTGLKYRRWTHLIGTPTNHEEENMTHLGIKAGNALFKKLNISPDEIDMIIVSSTTPHKTTTSSACAIADGLGVKAPSMDMKSGCSSCLYSLLNAVMYVKAGFEKVLLIASETPSKYANPQIKETVMGVGDGAIAILLEPTEEDTGIISGFLGSDGDLGKLVQTPGLLPPTHNAIDDNLYKYQGDSNALKEAVPIRYIDSMIHALKIAELNISDIDLYIPHQVNRYLTVKVAENLGIPTEKQYYNLHKYANLAGAAVLVALHDAIEENKISTGSIVAMNVVGGGLTWGAILWKF